MLKGDKEEEADAELQEELKAMVGEKMLKVFYSSHKFVAPK